MLSVLIPAFDWNPAALAVSLHGQLVAAGLPFEILISDDTPLSSQPDYSPDLEILDHTRLFWRQVPLGRSANRNFLADNARYENYLFIDCDAGIVDEHFIERYVRWLNTGQVVAGGTAYHLTRPENPDQVLRWRYGIRREMKPASVREKLPWNSFSTFNFLIPANTFHQIRFDESIRLYGHEDTLFGLSLMEKEIAVQHIQNPLYHLGLDPAGAFLNKIRESAIGLVRLEDQKIISKPLKKEIRLLKIFTIVRNLGLRPIFRVLFVLFRKSLERQLTGPNPSMQLLDLYKLGYISQIA